MSCFNLRGARRRHSVLRRHAAFAAALAAGLAATGPALASQYGAVNGVQNIVAPAITVESDGTKYDELVGSLAPIQGTLLVKVEAGVAGKVKSWKVWPTLIPGGNVWDGFGEGFPESGHAASYGLPRPKRVETGIDFAIPRADYATFMVQACNDHADELRGQGLSNSEIFAQDRQVQIGVWGRIEYETTSVGTAAPPLIPGEAPGFTLTCQRAPQVEQATLAVRGDASVSGACSLKLSGMIRTNLPDTPVKFRYRSDDGRESDLKTVVTGRNGAAPFSDEYPLSQGGTRAGKVRVVGDNFDFASDWKDYEVACGGPAQDVATVLPPEVVRLHAYEIEETMHRGLLCPSKVEIHGVLNGRGTASGAAATFADGAVKVWEAYEIEENQKVIIKRNHSLTWGPTQAQQNVKFAIEVINAQGDVVDRAEETQNFVCHEPETLGDAQGAAGDFGSTALEAPDLSLSFEWAGRKAVGSYLCPATLSFDAKVKANDAMDLRVIHFLEQPSIVIGQNSQAKEQTFSFVKNQHETFPQSFDLNWQGLSAAEGRPLQQPLKMTLRLARDGFVVAEEQKTLVLACVPGEQANARPAGSAIGRLAGQQAETFAIQAPKGLVRQGQIRLSGGAATAKYALSFLRKNGAGYTKVQAAQLPKQMTGMAASFPLQALTGGRDWRLEVCPLGGLPAGCKTADFRLTRIGGAANAAPQQEQPQGTIFLVPGVGQ